MDDPLTTLIERRAELAPDHVAIRCADGALTYAELAERGARAATVLRGHGVQRGSRVVAAVGNALDLPVALLACGRLGATLVPLNYKHRGDVLRYMVSHVEPDAVICDTALYDEGQLLDLRSSADAATWLEARAGDSAFLALAADADDHPDHARPEDPVLIIYTSGTTGRSKGALLSHRFVLCEADGFLDVVRPTTDDVFWSTLPLFHTNALCLTAAGAWLSGTTAVLRPGFSASRFWDEVGADGGTVVNLLGAMVPILLKVHEDRRSDHSVRLAVGGGVPPQVVTTFEERFSVDFREVYGLTETGLNAGQTTGAERPGSVGRPLAHWNIRVDAPAGKEGEIQIAERSSGAVLSGYFRDAERTREAFTEDGFFRTGDLGLFDSDGNLYWRGRIKDCIRRRGENISPTEVELAVGRHPAIAECAAVAVPSELAEDEVKVVYVVRDGFELDPAELHDFCRSEMADFMVPRYLEQRPELPKTPTEKIERFKLDGLGPSVRDMTEGPQKVTSAASARPRR